MVKGFRFLVCILLFISMSDLIHAQEKKFNERYKPVPVIKRLSYENFKNIRLLQTAIMNYGGGQIEIDKLVDQYADASALYFQNKYLDAANKFTENSREILKVSQKLVIIYHEATYKLITEAVKVKIKGDLADRTAGKPANEFTAKFFGNAKFAFNKAENLYEQYVKATNAAPIRLIEAIYYYRRTKESIFLMFESSRMDRDKSKDREMKDKMKEVFRKDIQDNKNKIFISKEKKN